MTSPREDVATFFAEFDRASNELDTAWLANAWGEQFLNLAPNAAGVVTREAFLASLPMRSRLFSSIGAHGTDLTDLSEHPLDEHHTLVETRWRVRFESSDAAPLTLGSAFLLRREGDRWQIVAYLNHQDIVATIQARNASTASPLPDTLS